MSLLNLNYPPIEQEPIYPSVTLLKQFGGNISPRGMAFNNGALYVVSFVSNLAPPSYVHKITFNPNNTIDMSDIVINTSNGTQGNLLKPYNIVFDTSNNFYVACQGNSNEGGTFPVILKYNANGTPVNFTSLNKNWFSGTKGNGLTVDACNNLFVLYSSSSIGVYDSITGNLKVKNLINTNLNNPTGIRFDSSSNLFVCNYSDNNVNKYSIKYNSGTPYVDVSSISYISNLFGPNDIHFDKYGFIYIGNQNNNSVTYYTKDGAYLGKFSDGFNQPSNIAFDQNNKLYVSNFNGGINGFINKLSYFVADINGPLRINESIGSIGSYKTGSLVLRHQDNPGCSSIIFQGYSNDYGYIRYNDTNESGSNAESGRLEIGTEDNAGSSANNYIDALVLQKNGGYVGIGVYNPLYTLDISGTIRCTNVTTTSDYRLKTNITSLDESYIIDKLKPVSYTFGNNKKPIIGFIAHEVQEEFPDLVDGEKDGKEFQTLYMMELIPILVKEIQQLKKDVELLKEKLQNLSSI